MKLEARDTALRICQEIEPGERGISFALFPGIGLCSRACGLASLKFVGQAYRLATFRQQLILEAEFLLPQGNLTFLLKVFQMIG